MYREKKKKVCLFLLLENSRPLSPLREPQTPFSSSRTLDFLSTCLGTDSLSSPSVNAYCISTSSSRSQVRGCPQKTQVQQITATLAWGSIKVWEEGPSSKTAITAGYWGPDDVTGQQQTLTCQSPSPTLAPLYSPCRQSFISIKSTLCSFGLQFH